MLLCAHVCTQMVEHLFSLVGGHQDHMTLPTTGKLQLAGYGGGLHISPRDLARLGVLLLADGVWHGRRLLDSSFVRDAMAPQAVGVNVSIVQPRFQPRASRNSMGLSVITLLIDVLIGKFPFLMHLSDTSDSPLIFCADAGAAEARWEGIQ